MSKQEPVINSKDHILPVDVHDQYMKNMAIYSVAISYERFVPSILDGLKPVQRRILYCMWHDIGSVSLGTKRKSGNIVGRVMGDYHPHNNQSIYDACQPLANWFQCKCPLINYDSNSGSIQGNPHASSRYTEIYLSKFSMDTIIADLIESQSVVDWGTTFDNKTNEPLYLPVKIPLLLVNGTFSIAIGERVEVPPHSLNDVIDVTLMLMKDPSTKVVLIPDPNQKCEVINTDWKKISSTGFGNFIERGIITIDYNSKNEPYLTIRSTPDLVTAIDVMEKIEELVKKNILVQVLDTEDHSSDKTGLDIRILLKKGSDPEYVRQLLYKHTGLQSTKHVNMRVITSDYEIHNISYKTYLLNFIEFRREVKFRLYNAKLQKVETRLHTIDTYIQILESGDVEQIIHAIRNQNPQEENQLIQWLMNKLKITDLQAKFILNTEIKKLSKSSLKGYKEEQKRLQSIIQDYINMITHPELIDKEIEQELLDIRAKYGMPRKSVLMSEGQANNIPQGTFKIVIYEDATIKKLQLNDPVKTYKGVGPKCVTVGDNDKDILLFDDVGRVFRLPIHKIPFNDKNLPGIDIRTLIKKLTSNIISVLYLPIMEALYNKSKKYYVVIVSKGGLIKYIDIADLLSATPSGIIYSKINNGDSICTVNIASLDSDVILYTHSKALRISMNDIPYLKRSTLGNIGIRVSNDPVMGMSIITKDTTDVVFVTSKGYFNRISQEALPRGKRAQTGTRAIKLTKGDYINNVFPCGKGSVIKCYHMNGAFTDIESYNIPEGSSISTGIKLTKEILKSEIVKL